MPLNKTNDKLVDTLTYNEYYIVTADNTKIYARRYAGEGSVLFLLHSFPNNIHLYDYLIPELQSDFRVIVFDFLGWDNSDKPKDYPYSAGSQLSELETVIKYFNYPEYWIAAHDASGSPAINYSLNYREKVQKLILFNTYYSANLNTKKPEAIWMFSIPGIRLITGFVARAFSFLTKKLYYWQVGKFIKNQVRRKEFVPKLYSRFSDKGNFSAFLKLNADLNKTIVSNTKRISEFGKLKSKTIIIFGAEDPYLKISAANKLEELIPGSVKN